MAKAAVIGLRNPVSPMKMDRMLGIVSTRINRGYMIPAAIGISNIL